MRYVMTGGDNGYCCGCGGLCDRVILEIDDKAKTYKVLHNGEGFCMGRYCWRQTKLNNGMWLVKGSTVATDGGDIFGCVVGGNKRPQKLRLMTEEEHDKWMEDRADTGVRVTVKGNKYGKDGEFGDRLDTYTYVKE